MLKSLAQGHRESLRQTQKETPGFFPHIHGESSQTLLFSGNVQLFYPIIKFVTAMTTHLAEVFLLLVLILGPTITSTDNYRCCFCFNALGRQEYSSLEKGFLKIVLIERQV